MSTTLGFIGTGIMGAPMAGHLLAAGHRLLVCNRTPAKAAALVERGAIFVQEPAAIAREADVLFLNLPDTPDVQRVMTADGGVLAGAHPGLVIVDHSTISPSATRDLAALASEKGAHFLDAPVSGGDIGAKNATLSIMVGGDPAAFAKVEPLLRIMGKTITHTGKSGSGQLTKLVNQILVAVTNLAVSEALTFATFAGLDPAKTITAVGGGAAGSWQLNNLGPKMLAGDFAPGFMIRLQTKDLRLVDSAAREMGLYLGGTSLVQRLFKLLEAAGRANDGTQALFDKVREIAPGRVD